MSKNTIRVLDPETDEKRCAYDLNLSLDQSGNCVSAFHAALRVSCCSGPEPLPTILGETLERFEKPPQLGWSSAFFGACFSRLRICGALCFSQVAHVHAHVLPFIFPHNQGAHF
jgi:hypothetical protein